MLAGREITINGTVEGDLIAAGQTVVINGTVRDDIRIVGQVLILDSKPTSARQYSQLDHLFPRLGCVLLVVDKTRSHDR
ncbi:hypothetical protein IQ277_24730 [Nostocales cyanobacterium LEGE 12452]|nr:hypothetical protein [Nostocales cyanobacterium LEGE 12452]